MKKLLTWVAMIAVAVAVVTPARAHHSVAVNFDQTNEVTIEGELMEMSWRNPHSHFRIEATNDDGTQMEWLVEMGAINTMRRAGFAVDVFEVGARMTAIGWPGRRDRTMYLLEVILEDGTRLICAGAACNPER